MCPYCYIFPILNLLITWNPLYLQEKLLKQKMQDDIAKAILAKNGAPLSISEHVAIVSQIKSDVAQAHAEILKAMGSVAKSMP